MFRIGQLYKSLAIFLGMFFVSAGYAADGVLEINQVCAENGGCFEGDGGGGFPVEITDNAPGSSFILTSDLEVNSGDAIQIRGQRRGITIDLNGFAIFGSGFGTGRGIDAEDRSGSDSNRNIIVRNGTIRDMGGNGIRLGPGSLVIDTVVAENGGDGIIVGEGSLVIRNVIFDNDDLGLNLADSATAGYKDNVITGNNGGNNNPQVDGGINLGGNVCGNARCPGDPNSPAEN